MNGPRAAALAESGIAAPPSSSDSCLGPDARRMLGAIEGLPADEREVFELVRIQGLTHAEAAGVVGVSVKTVQRRLNRARLLLAEQLADLRPTAPGGSSESIGDTPVSWGDLPMSSNPDVLALLEEILDSGRTPEEVCR